MFCKHDWELLSETTTESVVGRAKSLGLIVTNARGYDLECKFIQLLTCKKCGKINRFIEII